MFSKLRKLAKNTVFSRTRNEIVLLQGDDEASQTFQTFKKRCDFRIYHRFWRRLEGGSFSQWRFPEILYRESVVISSKTQWYIQAETMLWKVLLDLRSWINKDLFEAFKIAASCYEVVCSLYIYKSVSTY